MLSDIKLQFNQLFTKQSARGPNSQRQLLNASKSLNTLPADPTPVQTMGDLAESNEDEELADDVSDTDEQLAKQRPNPSDPLADNTHFSLDPLAGLRERGHQQIFKTKDQRPVQAIVLSPQPNFKTFDQAEPQNQQPKLAKMKGLTIDIDEIERQYEEMQRELKLHELLQSDNAYNL